MLQVVERTGAISLSGEQLVGGEDPKDSIDKVHSEKPVLPARDVSHSWSGREQGGLALRGPEHPGSSRQEGAWLGAPPDAALLAASLLG